MHVACALACALSRPSKPQISLRCANKIQMSKSVNDICETSQTCMFFALKFMNVYGMLFLQKNRRLIDFVI